MEKFVYAGQDTGEASPLTLSQLEKRQHKLSPAYQQRLKRVFKWLAQSGLQQSSFTVVNKSLRKDHFNAAHGSKFDWQHTSLQDLEAWTDQMYNDRPEFRKNCKKTLQIVASLSTTQHPLQLDKAPGTVLPAP